MKDVCCEVRSRTCAMRYEPRHVSTSLPIAHYGKGDRARDGKGDCVKGGGGVECATPGGSILFIGGLLHTRGQLLVFEVLSVPPLGAAFFHTGVRRRKHKLGPEKQFQVVPEWYKLPG